MSQLDKYNLIDFSYHVKLVLRQVHPDLSIRKDASLNMSLLLNFILRKIIKRINFREIDKYKKLKNQQDDIFSFVPGLLKDFCIREGNKAVEKYKTTYSSEYDDEKLDLSYRCGLKFRVDKIKTVYDYNIKLIIYITAVLEYLCAEIMEIAGNFTRNRRRVYVTKKFLKETIYEDPELGELKNKFSGKLKELFD